MDVYDNAFLDLWKYLSKHQVRYIMVGGFATNLHGFQRYTGDIDLYIEDTLINRQNLRKAFRDIGLGDFDAIERIQFVPGWVNFTLDNGVSLDIMTTLRGVELSFSECLQEAPIAEIEGIKVPFLHINHLIANKKAVWRAKDQIDVLELERIKRLRGEEGAPTG